MNAQITMDRRWKTVAGKPVRLLCLDAGTEGEGKYIVGLIQEPTGYEHVQTWRSDGLTEGCPEDRLVPVPTKHEAWTILEKRHVVFYSDKSTAQENLEREDPFHPCFLAYITWESES